MKIIITESQSKLLIDRDFDIWFKRRFSEETMDHFIKRAEETFPPDCEEYSDEYEYVDTVIDEAIDIFLTMYTEDFWMSDNVSTLMDYVRKNVREWYSDKISEIYRRDCE